MLADLVVRRTVGHDNDRDQPRRCRSRIFEVASQGDGRAPRTLRPTKWKLFSERNRNTSPSRRSSLVRVGRPVITSRFGADSQHKAFFLVSSPRSAWQIDTIIVDPYAHHSSDSSEVSPCLPSEFDNAEAWIVTHPRAFFDLERLEQ